MNGVSNGIHCTAQHLCAKPDGTEACSTIGRDYESCQYFLRENIMIVPPREIMCSNACKCKYAGKRDPDCREAEGHRYCGATLGGKVPEGDIPDSITARIIQVIPRCALEEAVNLAP